MAEGIQIEHLPDDLMETISMIVSHEENIKKEPETDFLLTIDNYNNSNECFVIEEYEEAPEAIVHPSIGDSRAFFLEKLKNAGHCFLCTDQEFSTTLEAHFTNCHLRHNVNIAGKFIVACHLGCKKGPHFHCSYPDCLFSCKHKHNLKIHFLNHRSQGAEATQEAHAEFVGIPIKQEPEDPVYTELQPLSIDYPMNETTFAVPDKQTVHSLVKSESAEELVHEVSIGISTEKLSIGTCNEDLIRRLKAPYCYLCSDFKTYIKSRLFRHFSQLHLGHSARFEGCVIALCKLDCCIGGFSHYHCPYPHCGYYVRAKARLLTHYKTHKHTVKLNPVHDEDNDKGLFGKKILFPQKPVLPLPSPKKTFPFHGIQYFPHESIRPSAQDLFEYLCLPFCYLCDSPGYFYTMRRLERHFRMAHMNRGVDCGSCYLVLCGLNCIPGKNRKHYHCPFCAPDDPKKCVATSRYRFWVHLEMHRREMFISQPAAVKQNGFDDKDVPDLIDNRDFRHSAEINNVITPQNWDVTYRGQPVIQHPSVTTDTDAVLAKASLPNCYLCSDDKDHIYHKRLLAHISRVHLKPMFQVDNIFVMLCKRKCSRRSYNRGHYHCFLCDFFALHKGRLEIHLQKHVNNMRKRTVMAEYHVPNVVQDHSVPDEWLDDDNRQEVRDWERTFNAFLNDYSKSKTHNKVITERMKWLIYNHLKCGMDIEHRNLKYWVQFRKINVISCSRLDLENVLVMPLTKYNNVGEGHGVRVPPDPQFDGNDLVLTSDDPYQEFLESYRLIPTCEEMFKLLYHIHNISDNHPSSKIMFGHLRRKYLYLPRAIVDKYVELCPSCCVNIPDASANNPVVNVDHGDTVNLAGIQITVVDMTEHPDGKFKYVVECFDRCSRLTWLFPAERAVANDIAEALVKTVFCVTGLPCYVITNCGYDFLEKMLGEIERRWYGSSVNLINNSREAAHKLSVLGSDDLMSVLQDIVRQSPNSWSLELPHVQYRLNHAQRRKNEDMSPYELVLGRKRISRTAEQRTAVAVHRHSKQPAVHLSEESEEEEEEESS